MDVKKVVQRQYRTRVNNAREAAAALPRVPSEGWLRTVRRALGMSTSALARRMGISRARVAQIEHGEREQTLTLATLRRTAEAMGCRLVYAVVPEHDVEAMISEQARKKAEAIVMSTARHMALEEQTPSKAYLEEQIQDLADQLEREGGRDFWEEL